MHELLLMYFCVLGTQLSAWNELSARNICSNELNWKSTLVVLEMEECHLLPFSDY